MSRTDVHRPWRVQITDPYMRHRLWRFAVWPWQMDLLPIGYWSCGCRICTNHWGRKEDRRKQRVAWRKVRHTLLRTPTDDLETVDVGSVRGSHTRSY